MNFPPDQLRNLKNLGQKSLDEIEEILKDNSTISSNKEL